MQSIISTDQILVNNLDAPDAFRIANRHHRYVKASRKRQQAQLEAKICRIAKRTLAFSGFLLFLLCLWALR